MIKNTQKLFILLALIGISIMIIFFSISYNRVVDTGFNNILINTKADIKQMILFRHWISKFNGVYVPQSIQKPNSYLKVNNRDLKTIQGQELTLVNPAWMTRQVFKLSNEDSSNTIKQLISNDYINPINKSDEWQKKILLKFEKNQDMNEYYEVVDNTLKYIQPLKANKSCLKCHPNYVLNKIEGGISFYIDLTKFNLFKSNELQYAIISALLIIFIALVFLFILYKVVLKVGRLHQDILENTKFTIIGQMAAGITHEINTPLTYIKGTLEMSKYDLENMPNNDFKKRLIEDNKKIMDGIDRMSIIIESMREVSQNTPVVRDEFNVYSTLITVLRMIYNRSKQVSKIYINNELFDFETSDKEKYQFLSSLHKQRIEQVWTIILNNALDELVKLDDYNDRRIDINILNNNGKVEVEFQDNAGGIPDDMIDKIFNPFVSTKESSGIGIGLNVAKKIIEEHDATIEVENKNKGACFIIKLN